MAIQTDVFLQYLNELMQPKKFQDYCPNGLQVQGKGTINKIITGVSATQELIDRAKCRRYSSASWLLLER